MRLIPVLSLCGWTVKQGFDVNHRRPSFQSRLKAGSGTTSKCLHLPGTGTLFKAGFKVFKVLGLEGGVITTPEGLATRPPLLDEPDQNIWR